MLQRFPEQWQIWVTAGRVCVGQFQEIELGCQLSAQALRLQPQLADAWFQHGQVLAIAGHPQDAMQALEKGWQVLPEQGGAQPAVSAALWLGEQYHRDGDAAQGQYWLNIASDRAETLTAFCTATADYWRGRILAVLGDREGAIAAYRSALSQQLLYPARREVEAALSQL